MPSSKPDFNSEFFGECAQPVTRCPTSPNTRPCWPPAYERGAFRANLSVNYVDSVCTQASCGAFEETEDATLMDLASALSPQQGLGDLRNRGKPTDELYIAGRQPYGARPSKPRSYTWPVCDSTFRPLRGRNRPEIRFARLAQ